MLFACFRGYFPFSPSVLLRSFAAISLFPPLCSLRPLWLISPKFRIDANGASILWIASRQERQERQDSEPISCSRSDPVPAKPDQVTERNVVRKSQTSPLCGWMPSAFMNYGVTGRQQDGATLQQESIKKILFAPAILFRQRRIKRPKEALLIIIPHS